MVKVRFCFIGISFNQSCSSVDNYFFNTLNHQFIVLVTSRFVTEMVIPYFTLFVNKYKNRTLFTK